jgi:hypothetical protein
MQIYALGSPCFEFYSFELDLYFGFRGSDFGFSSFLARRFQKRLHLRF